MDIISPISLRFHNSLLETSFYSAHNAQLHAYDVACSLALPLIPLAVVARRCYALLPTSICRLFGHCRHPQSCPVPVPFAARPVINTALLAHAVVYLTLITTLLFASRAWLAHRRVLIACAMRMWYTCILPVIVCLQPRGKSGGEYTCTYLQGLHLHTVLLTTAIVPLCHQVPFSMHIPLTILALTAAGVATVPYTGIAHGLVFLVTKASVPRSPLGEADCRTLLTMETWMGRMVGFVINHANPGVVGLLGLKAPSDDAWLVTIALLVLHLLVTVPVTALLYYRELLLRIEYVRQQRAEVPVFLAWQWTMRCVLLLGAMAVQMVLLCTLL